ncbi:MAG: hypothetical protein R3C41_05610 [Calditrichia bacterium]|nr:hypothetical protein [Calditrichota bacterium]MCB0266578.1 hypothetical protein [Calditrichota bacterium]MCB0287102.1 hypothetical protein [Calditrichota bacterium]MCB9069917.1 hypothetical protein [Calditrichia bacterium]
MENRNLVGRRYEDFLRHDIVINLTDEERLWRAIYADPRFNSLVERRTTIRRKTDIPEDNSTPLFHAESSFVFTDDAGDDWQ